MKKHNIKMVVLFLLSSVLILYVVYIAYLFNRIREIDRNNAAIMDQMRILYELKNDFEYSDDSNVMSNNGAIDTANYCNRETEHFSIYARNGAICGEIAEMIEKVLSNLLEDLEYNISLNKKIKIFIFKDREEYSSKIRQIGWSVGKVIYGKNSFYSYEGVNLEGLLHHELTHLLFYYFLNRQYIPENMRWLSEGLATYEEGRFIKSKLIMFLENQWSYFREGNFLSIETLMRAEALTHDNKRNVHQWYAQSLSTVGFLIERYGRERFNNFCRNISKTSNLDIALSNSYGASFNGSGDLTKQWLAYINTQ